MKFIKLKLFSPIIVKGEAPYENPWDGGDDYRILIEREKKKCRNEIYVSSYIKMKYRQNYQYHSELFRTGLAKLLKF